MKIRKWILVKNLNYALKRSHPVMLCCTMVYQLCYVNKKHAARITWAALQMVCYMKYQTDQIWPPSCLRFDNNACAKLRYILVTNKVKTINLKAFNVVIKCFYFFWIRKKAGVFDWPLQLLNYRSKICLTRILLLRPNGRIFLACMAPSQFFLRESRKAAAWCEHWFHVLLAWRKCACFAGLLLSCLFTNLAD